MPAAEKSTARTVVKRFGLPATWPLVLQDSERALSSHVHVVAFVAKPAVPSRVSPSSSYMTCVASRPARTGASIGVRHSTGANTRHPA